jgi:hypothetical protein
MLSEYQSFLVYQYTFLEVFMSFSQKNLVVKYVCMYVHIGKRLSFLSNIKDIIRHVCDSYIVCNLWFWNQNS